MTIEAKIILDSISECGIRLTTFQLIFPRFILPEFNTHRTFSRNSASSRAIPTEKMLDMIVNNPAMPVHWGKNQKGMQANEELDIAEKLAVKNLWLKARDLTVETVREMMQYEPHKQTINRLLEPYMHIQVVCTATEWDNFYSLRAHKDAQPEIQALAYAMRDAHDHSVPKILRQGQWHIPYILDEEQNMPNAVKTQLSTARCARVSYWYHDGKKPSIEQDLQLHDRLVGSKPIHASPTEHQAICMNDNKQYKNFVGWDQYRSFIEQHLTVQ